MRPPLPLVLILLLLTSCTTTHNNPNPNLTPLLSIRAPTNLTLAPDNTTIYVRDWQNGINQLYRLEPNGQLGPCLTSFPDGLSNYSLSPDGQRILLSAATGGNEQSQLYTLSDLCNRGHG